jgi:hypothetical protein
MILWGWGERVLGFDVEEHQFCENCRENANFRMRLKYTYGHFYHLFGWVISKQYQLVCPACTHGWLLNTRSAEEKLRGNPIPFHQRSGWLVMALLAVAIGIGVAAHRGVF